MQLLKIISICILCSAVAVGCKKDAAKKQPFGPYLLDFKEWGAADSISVPISDSAFFFVGHPVQFNAADTLGDTITTVVESGGLANIFSLSYNLAFDNSEYNLLSVSFTLTSMSALAQTGSTIIDGPNILINDPVNQTFEFQYTVQESTGVFRYIVDKYYRQQ